MKYNQINLWRKPKKMWLVINCKWEFRASQNSPKRFLVFSDIHDYTVVPFAVCASSLRRPKRLTHFADTHRRVDVRKQLRRIISALRHVREAHRSDFEVALTKRRGALLHSAHYLNGGHRRERQTVSNPFSESVYGILQRNPLTNLLGFLTATNYRKESLPYLGIVERIHQCFPLGDHTRMLCWIHLIFKQKFFLIKIWFWFHFSIALSRFKGSVAKEQQPQYAHSCPCQYESGVGNIFRSCSLV